ncbi:MAG: nucleotidyltransferase domain-containing protein [Candidatus Pacearchaeota archaeon]
MLAKLENFLKKKLKGIDLKEIVDIVLFGSAVKGKEFPRDIDVCIIFREKINQEIIKRLSLRWGSNIHLSVLVVDNFFRKPHSLIKTILIEGKSLLTNKSIAKNFGFSGAALYSYDISKLKPSSKVRFIYLLKGRKSSKGIVSQFRGEWITDSCFIIPIEKDNEMITILKKWRVQYKRKEILLH